MITGGKKNKNKHPNWETLILDNVYNWETFLLLIPLKFVLLQYIFGPEIHLRLSCVTAR